jgi:hypothetical protein
MFDKVKFVQYSHEPAYRQTSFFIWLSSTIFAMKLKHKIKFPLTN